MPKKDQVVSALQKIVGKAGVIQAPKKLKDCAVDGLVPKAIVCPKNEKEIAKVLIFANANKMSVVPRGSGTKMAAGGVPRKVDLVLSMSKLNRVVDYDKANLSLSVQAGITLDALQKKLAKGRKGNFLPLDPPFTEKATIGGIVATNSSGPKRYFYGTARDMLLGIKAVSPSGDIVSFGGKTMKNVSGYDMTKLMIGTWGGLGIITEITTKLLPLPEASATLLISFGDLEAAGKYIRKIVHSILLPSAVELISGAAAERLGEKSKYLLALSLEGVVEAVARQVSEISDTSKKEGAKGVKVLKGAKEKAFWLHVRDFGNGLAKKYGSPVILKSNFVISKHVELMARCEKITETAGVRAAFICHAGNGILYTYILEKPGAGAKLNGLIEVIGRLTLEAVKDEGNLVVESCPLEMKGKISVWGQPRHDQILMRRLKEKMDPGGVLNPGRFVGGI